MTDANIEPIPQPPGRLLVGNLFDLDRENAIKSLVDLMKQYGEIIHLNMLGRSVIAVGSQKLVHELCDQERFEKTVQGALANVRQLAGDGLFTAHQHEESWAIAHRILIPAFGPLSIRNMFGGMVDIADQLIAKWHRFGGQRIDVTGDFTKLTLDTIALCTFSHRFNSFYTEDHPPFVEAMARSLKGSGLKLRRLPGTAWAYRQTDKQIEADIKLQHDMADDIVRERMESKEDKGDLLDTMLKGRDPKTGRGLSPENIRYQMVTFLIAGHETTSGLLSFLFHFLLAHPAAAQKIREEVDRVIGSNPVEYSHLQRLEYIDAALKETLRLKSTAPAFSVTPKKDGELLDGRYQVKKGEPIQIILDALHRDPAVWGNDAEEFRPERMLDGGFTNLPPDSWKPFGNGMRGCIGRPFAWQESLLVVAKIFQHFDVRPYNPSYELKIKTSLTIKPDDFYMYVSPRKDRDFSNLSATSPVASHEDTHKPISTSAETSKDNTNTSKLHVFYGSNAGTCKALAQKLVDTASRRGVKVDLHQLNDVSDGSLPKDGPIAIVTASYEGQPTDDANFFHQWLLHAKEGSVSGIKYAVFGCGHPDWQATFHAVPTKIDERLAECGGERIIPRGAGNAAAAELFEQFDDWEESFLVNAFKDGQQAGADKTILEAEINRNVRQEMLSYGELQSAMVVSNEIITHNSRDIKRHISLELPENLTYRTGDYLALLPITPLPLVQRALNRFKLHPDDEVTLKGSGKSFNLPLDKPISAFDLFAGFVELAQPVSLRRIQSLLEIAGEDKDALARYTEPEVFEKEINAKRISLLDLLEEFPKLDLPLGQFLLALPPIRIRQYSISSSPLADPTRATLTVSVIDAPHISGRGTVFLGTATNFLSKCVPGSYVRMTIRPSNAAFHPPLDPSVPVLMAGAGSGIAPFRAFVQERALQKANGRKVGPALLFYGCHTPDTDALYDDEMKAWEAQGVVSVRYAFSRAGNASYGCKYVQDRIWHDREEASELFKSSARVFICGSPALAKGVKEICAEIYAEAKKVDMSDAEKWVKSIESERFATDVFA